jgi:cytoskeletal protein RodZ
MERPGEYLKKERELRGVALQELSSALKLSLSTLKAVEEDDYKKLPHPAYIKGFIRAYCRHLGLDENDCVLRFESYLKEKEQGEEKEPEKKRAVPQRRASGRILAALFVLGVFIIVGYFFVSRRGVEPLPRSAVEPPVEEKPEAEVEMKPLPEEKAPPLAAPEKHTLAVRAKETVWIRAEIDDGEPFEVLLREGERVEWTAERVFFCS